MVVVLKPAILKLCHKFFYDDVLAESVAWRVFFVIWDKIESFKGQSAFSSWVYRVTTNECLMAIRQNKFWARRFLGSEEEEGKLLERKSTVCPLKMLLAKEVLRGIQEVLQKKSLPVFQQYLLKNILKRSKNNTNAELAREINSSLPRVKSAIHRNRKELYKKLVANE